MVWTWTYPHWPAAADPHRCRHATACDCLLPLVCVEPAAPCELPSGSQGGAVAECGGSPGRRSGY